MKLNNFKPKMRFFKYWLVAFFSISSNELNDVSALTFESNSLAVIFQSRK